MSDYDGQDQAYQDLLEENRKLLSHHKEFDIIDIERDSQNGDDIHIHLKDKDGHIYKGIITGIEDLRPSFDKNIDW